MTAQPSDYTEFPHEIIAKPLSLIFLAGLDTINNAIHKCIWDAFSNNRKAERVPAQFKLLDSSCEFPVAKPKRNSYEWYIPKGILKKNWINKRLNLVPAVIVIFYDMEWDDPQWNEKLIECVSRVQSIRAAIEGHATRIAVVVIQSRPAPPPSENMTGAERAQALCQACDIQSKSLLVLPHGDHLLNYVIRLENAFYDLAQNYYHHETKNIKQHKDHLNKTTHQYLFVRHQFKLGYLNELKQDYSTAHKHYTHAYNNLLETRIVETNTCEVKTVAGYINYKLCKLFFDLNLPRDAITQFRAHIDRYKKRSGQNDLLFEHFAWLSRQYSAFGELFEEAIRAGFNAIQSQHPGFFYQQAAQLTVKRRVAIHQICHEALQYPTPDPLLGIVEFYGQRPWRPGRLSADPHDPQKEQSAIQALQYKELHFNHSAMIISFLGSAITHFKTFHSPRMRKQLVVQMANEYYLSADYGKALTLLNHMLYDYRREKWWYISSHILNRALSCAYLSAKIFDYLNLAIEGLSKNFTLGNNDKERIFNNIQSVLNCTIPNPEPDLPKKSLESALELWTNVIDKDPLHIQIDMASIANFLEVKVRFTETKFRLDESIVFDVIVRLLCPITLEVNSVVAIVVSQQETLQLPILNDLAIFKAGQIEKFSCKFRLKEETLTDIVIKNIIFRLSRDCKRKIDLTFSPSSNNEHNIHPELLHFLSKTKVDYEFDSIISLPVARVIAREANIDFEIKHDNPALLGEWYLVNYIIVNNETKFIRNIKVNISVVSSPEETNINSTVKLNNKPESANTSQTLSDTIEQIKSLKCHHSQFYLKCKKALMVGILLKVTYTIEISNNKNVECSKETLTKIDIIKPFEISAKFMSMSFKNVDKCFIGDPFVVMPELKILSPWKLIVEDAVLELADSFIYTDTEKPETCLKNEQVCEGITTSDAFCVTARDMTSLLPVHVGLYNIKWRRISDDYQTSPVFSSMPLPSILIDKCPINVNGKILKQAELQIPVYLECSLRSNKDTPVQVTISTEGTDAYMYAGYKKRSITVLPDSNQVAVYTINPLVCGATTPPKLKPIIQVTDKISVENSTSKLMEEIFEKNLPHNVYVMPNNKN